MTRYRLVTVLLVLASIALAEEGFTQGPSDRAELRAIDAALDQAASVSQLPDASLSTLRVTRARGEGPISRLHAGLIHLRAGELAAQRDRLDQAEAAFDEAAFRAPNDWPWPWYGLARAKLALAERGAVAKASMHQPEGDSYRTAALRMLARALEADSSFVPAAALLAEVLRPLGERELSGALQRAVVRAAASGAGPAPFLALGRMFRNRGEPDSALKAFRAYVAVGGDSGVGLLDEARALHALGRVGEAVNAYHIGAAAGASAGRAVYRTDLAWLASPSELAMFDSLSPDSIGPWLTAFWANRDATQLRSPGARLAEHLRRWRYVHEEFVVTGRQDGTGFVASTTDCGPSGITDAVNSDAFPSDLKFYFPGVLPATQRGQRFIDDRGIVYMRHGEPDARVTALAERTLSQGATTPASLEIRPNASWKYNLPTGALIFHFCGSRALGTQAATTLIAVLPLMYEMIEARGGLDSRFNRLAGDLLQQRLDAEAKGRGLKGSSSFNLVSRSLVQTLENEGKADIRTGLATDSYTPRFREQLTPLVQIFAVGEPDYRQGAALLVFALPGEKLTPTPLPQGGVAYPVTLRFIATNARGEISRLDTTRTFRTADTLRGGQYLTGLAELPLPTIGTWDIRTIFTQPGTESGGAVGRLGVALPSASGLGLSDLIFGREGSGLVWQHAGTTIPLNPLDVYPRDGTVEVYYELSGLTPASRYETTIRIEGVAGDTEGEVEIGFTETARAAFEGIRRSVDLDELKGGQYQLTVTVEERGTGRKVTRSRLINVQER